MAKFSVLFFGDSFTSCPGLEVRDNWPSMVRDKSRKHFARELELSFCVSSAVQENTRTALERMQKDIQFKKPDIIFIQFGTNDSTHLLSNRGVPIVSQSAFRANLVEMIERCRRFEIFRVAFLTSHQVALNRFDVNGLTPDQNTALYDNIIRDVAAAHGCPVADIRLACQNIDPKQICADDLIHVNKYGASLYAKVVTPILIDLINGLLALEKVQLQVSSEQL